MSRRTRVHQTTGVSADTLSAILQDPISTLTLVITSPSTSMVHTVVTEIVTEVASAEIEATAIVVALGLVAAAAARHRHRYSPAVSVLGFALALFTLAVAVRTDGWATHADAPITGWLVDHRTSTLNHLAVVVTSAGGPPETAALGCVIAALLIWRTKRYVPALILLATVGVSAVICTLLKLLVGRERPPSATRLVLETDHSFPSGHVTGTATLLLMTVLVVGHLSRTRRVALLIAALAVTALVAASRLYLGVHWFTDVAAGLLLACIMVTAGTIALRVDAAHAHRPPRHRTEPSIDDEVTV